MCRAARIGLVKASYEELNGCYFGPSERGGTVRLSPIDRWKDLPIRIN